MFLFLAPEFVSSKWIGKGIMLLSGYKFFIQTETGQKSR